MTCHHDALLYLHRAITFTARRSDALPLRRYLLHRFALNALPAFNAFCLAFGTNSHTARCDSTVGAVANDVHIALTTPGYAALVVGDIQLPLVPVPRGCPPHDAVG